MSPWFACIAIDFPAHTHTHTHTHTHARTHTHTHAHTRTHTHTHTQRNFQNNLLLLESLLNPKPSVFLRTISWYLFTGRYQIKVFRNKLHFKMVFCSLKFGVSEKFHLGFSVRRYRKARMEFLADPITRVTGHVWSSPGRMFHCPCSSSCLSFTLFTPWDPGGSDSKESACNEGDLGSILMQGRSPGGGHGYPLQYSCLENPMDRGAWRATVHGVEKSWTWLTE